MNNLTMRSPVVLIAFAATLANGANGAESMLENFVTRGGDGLFDGEKPVRFISWNIPNLQNIEDAFTFLGDSPWRWPNDYEIADALESTRQMGGAVVRTYVLSVKREGSDMGGHVHVLAPGEFNEEAFEALDRVLAVANQKGVRLIIPLVDQWHWMGGIRQYEAFRGKPEDAFWTDPELIADFKKTVDYVVNRRNTVTGQLYKDDKAILCWETGNEITSPASWTREIAAYLKSVDPNHLVMDGRSLHGVPEWSLADPNVDIITTHHYPGGSRPIAEVVRAAAAETAGRKPYVVGEIGFFPNADLAEVFDDAIHSHTAGVLVWSLRFRNRDGGFYAHSEPAAQGRYKAYHWPGFASGEAYDETALLTLMRRKAYEILGEELPALAPPAPAELLPIEDPACITWRGSTGASSCDVERATSPDGPWRTIAREVSDAGVYYRPLFADTTADPGVDYYYRVVARNSSGRSEPSNTVGPVNADAHVLVDELANLDQMDSADGEVEFDSGDARAVQEDPHVLKMGPGSCVAYRTQGPIERVVVYAFGVVDDLPTMTISDSDGGSETTLEVSVEAPNRPKGDYGYLTPMVLEAKPESPRGSVVRLTHAETVSSPLRIGRVVINYGDR